MRKKKTLHLGVVAALLGSALSADDITGDWQGTVTRGSVERRVIFQITRGDGSGWKATMYIIDLSPDPIPVTSVSLDGSNLKMTVEAAKSTYEGKISVDGASIKGTWNPLVGLLPPVVPLVLQRATKETAWPLDPTAHSVQFITVDNNVKLEVLDWGGSGRPLVLLTGLGNNAHVYDGFAPKLTTSYHVYGITRRGFGASSAPATGYSADRLGDDVLAVLDALRLNRPVLVGHSIGGEELSSIGSRHPERVAGLIYLDCYGYAYYDRSQGWLNIDLIEIGKKLELLRSGTGKEDPRHLVQELLETSLPGFEKDLRELQSDFQAMSAAELGQWSKPLPAAQRAIQDGEQKYTNIPVPILAIFAIPHELELGIGKDPQRARCP